MILGCGLLVGMSGETMTIKTRPSWPHLVLVLVACIPAAPPAPPGVPRTTAYFEGSIGVRRCAPAHEPPVAPPINNPCCEIPIPVHLKRHGLAGGGGQTATHGKVKGRHGSENKGRPVATTWAGKGVLRTGPGGGGGGDWHNTMQNGEGRGAWKHWICRFGEDLPGAVL